MKLSWKFHFIVVQVRLRKIPKSATNVRCTVDVLGDLLLGVVVADLTSYTTKSWFFSRKDSFARPRFSRASYFTLATGLCMHSDRKEALSMNWFAWSLYNSTFNATFFWCRVVCVVMISTSQQPNLPVFGMVASIVMMTSLTSQSKIFLVSNLQGPISRSSR